MIQWDEKEYSVGIVKFDNQHRQLFGLINALEAKKTNAEKDFVEKIINTLVVYVRTHFTEEEMFLKKVKFPGIDRHAEQHRNFANQMIEFKQRLLNSKDQSKTATEICNFLLKWLINHIQVEDREYAQFLQLL